MKNPTSRTANRTIDVIFVHPKYRSYVIWHDGVFYQLTRMNLTQKAWDRREVYDGLLDEIFVARQSCEQGEIDEHAFKELGLNVVKLPDELHSITASNFLAWWTVNRYGFWHTKDIKDVSDKAGKNSDMMDDAVQTNQANQANQALTRQVEMQASPKLTHKSHKPLEQLSGDDIFDALLDDLIDEVSHLK